MEISRIPRTPTRDRCQAPAYISVSGRNREMGLVQQDNLPPSPWGARPLGWSSPSMSRRAGLLQRSRSHLHSNNKAESSWPGRQVIRRYPSDREILKRALAPPARRSGHRCFNFRPTPSRLSNMSMACETS